MKRLSVLLTVCFAVVLITAISCGKRHPDHSSVLISDIRIDRFENELFTVDPADIENHIVQWREEYSEFFYHFCWITGLGTPDDPNFAERLRIFATDRNNYELYKRTMEIFPDLDDLAVQLKEAFSNYKYYFPGMPVPRIFTYISGLARSAVTDDSLLAIGLDRYLGTSEPIYRAAGIYRYLVEKMHPAKIASDCMNFWAETEFPFNDSVNNLIANMIYKGRLLYFTKKMLPDQPDSLTLGFSPVHLRYLNDYEESIWAYLVEQKLLFNTDRLTINKFVAEGPFTTDFGHRSPARAAVWIGYRITEEYMKRNPQIDLESLMRERNYLNILNGSGYNP